MKPQKRKRNNTALRSLLMVLKMEMTLSTNHDVSTLIELDALEIEQVSGGHVAVAVAAATAAVTLGKSALEFGRSLGASVYRILN